MKNLKKLLSFFLALVMCLGMLPMGALAAEEAVVADMPEELLLTLDEEAAEEEPAEESAEEAPVEEPAEEAAAEEPAEEAPVEEPAEEPVVEEPAEEPVEEDGAAVTESMDITVELAECADGATAEGLVEGDPSALSAPDAEYAYNNRILLDADFVGTSWTYGTTVKIPFTLFCYGYSYQKYYVEIYNDNGSKVATTSGYFPAVTGIRYLTVTWSGNHTPGKYWVRFYATYSSDLDDMLYAFYVTSSSSSSGIAVNSTNFPDSNFRSYVSSNLDTSGNGYLSTSEISAVKKIDVSESSISSLTGISYFTALEELYCYDNSLSSLNLSSNTNLKHVSAWGNDLTSISVNSCTKLEYLDCSYNELTSLTISGLTKLETLYCEKNNLSTLDLSANTALTFLCAYGNSFSSLDISANTALESIYINDNPLTTLDVRNSPALVKARLYGEKTVSDGIAEYYYSVGDEYGLIYCDADDTIVCSAMSGWQKIDGKWYYYEGGKAVTGWKKVSGKWYYMNSSGVMQTGWQQIGGKWYYLNSSGVMQTGWQQIGGKWYYLNSAGAMLTGWQQIGGKWYYLKNYMLTGWQKVGGKWYYLKNYMLTGWQKIGGEYYYLGTNGAMQTGWVYVKGWYYLKSDGTMASDEYLVIDNIWYYFYTNGTYIKMG